MKAKNSDNENGKYVIHLYIYVKDWHLNLVEAKVLEYLHKQNRPYSSSYSE